MPRLNSTLMTQIASLMNAEKISAYQRGNLRDQRSIPEQT